MTQPLCEDFGYQVGDFSSEAVNSRQNKLCPYNNHSPLCTKDKVLNPLGVCSIWDGGTPVIICPIRFRQNWRVITDTKNFLLPNARNRTKVTEVGLINSDNETVGKIDIVLVEKNREVVADFGALEIQAVYISGNVRNPFQWYMEDPGTHHDSNWAGPGYPGPDWLSSIKRLEHQLIAKGRIFKSWGKRMAVAVESRFYDNFRTLQGISEVQSSMPILLGFFIN